MRGVPALVLSLLCCGALATPTARAKVPPKKTSKATVKALTAISKQILLALRRRRPVKQFMSRRVAVTYETDDRAEGQFKGAITVVGRRLDRVVVVPGQAGGYAWESKKKIPRHQTTVKFELREAVQRIAKHGGWYEEGGEVPTPDAQTMSLELVAASETVLLSFRWAPLSKQKARKTRRQRRRLEVFKIDYSLIDPG